MSLPDPYLVEPVAGPVELRLRVPGSKSFSNRALPIAAVAHGRSRITHLLDCDDTLVMLRALERLGIHVTPDRSRRSADVDGVGGPFPSQQAELDLENSGTSIRFLSAMLCAGRGKFRLDGNERMRQRPIDGLTRALSTLGLAIRSEAGNDCPPIVIEASGLPEGTIHVRGDVSSQFLSGLLMAAPLASGPLSIAVDGPLVSAPYVDMTLSVMKAFGATCERQDYTEFHFPSPQGYQATEYDIEPDASAASYFFAAAAILGGEVTIEGLGHNSLQGDLGFVELLARMGCVVSQTSSSTTVVGGKLVGIDVDMQHLSDTVPTLAVVAAFAEGTTRIRNVAHIRKKESDRIAAMAAELRKTGADVEEKDDGLAIHSQAKNGGVIDTYNDHRIAMAMALVGLKIPGIQIREPDCTTKTYPDFFADLCRLQPSLE